MFWANLYGLSGGVMAISIGCKELGVDCDFVTQREAEEYVIDSFMRHIQTEHAEDWFEIEEIYQAACKVIRGKVA
jgi:predicted small metal-binding protein